MPEQNNRSLTDIETVPDRDYYIRYLENELAQARRFEEIGIMAGVVAHDINNMLTPIFGYATILKRDLATDHPLAKAVGTIEKSAERAALLVSKLLGCSRQQDPLRIQFDIISMLDMYLEHSAGTVGSIEKSYADVPAVLGDPHQIAVVIRAVADNAVAAVQNGGALYIDVAEVTIDAGFCRYHPPVKPGPHVCITIRDTGCGMPADVLAKAFEPFFTTRIPGECAGIGLTIAQSLLVRNCGCIDLESSAGQGTTARIYLPASESHR